MRIVTVLPVHTTLAPEAAVDAWTTSTRLLEALAATGEVEPVGVAWGSSPATFDRAGVRHVFAVGQRGLVRAVRDSAPDSVHVHGTRSVRLLAGLRLVLGRRVPIVVQHHGEPPRALAPLRGAVGRAVSQRVDGWTFTGADHGQAEPFRRAGLIGARALVADVIEAGCTLPPDDGADAVVLAGSPSVLWVGRLVDDKDPLAAVRAIAAAARTTDAHLHLLATDRTLEPAVRSLAGELGVADRVHVHERVAPSAMHHWYRGADLLMSTSRHEGSNYSLIEALQHGCTPAVTDIPPHRSIVGDVAATFPVGDADAAARLVVRGPLPRDVVVTASTHTSWEAVAQQVLAAHRRVSSARRY